METTCSPWPSSNCGADWGLAAPARTPGSATAISASTRNSRFINYLQRPVLRRHVVVGTIVIPKVPYGAREVVAPGQGATPRQRGLERGADLAGAGPHPLRPRVARGRHSVDNHVHAVAQRQRDDSRCGG